MSFADVVQRSMRRNGPKSSTTVTAAVPAPAASAAASSATITAPSHKAEGPQRAVAATPPPPPALPAESVAQLLRAGNIRWSDEVPTPQKTAANTPDKRPVSPPRMSPDNDDKLNALPPPAAATAAGATAGASATPPKPKRARGGNARAPSPKGRSPPVRAQAPPSSQMGKSLSTPPVADLSPGVLSEALNSAPLHSEPPIAVAHGSPPPQSTRRQHHHRQHQQPHPHPHPQKHFHHDAVPAEMSPNESHMQNMMLHPPDIPEGYIFHGVVTAREGTILRIMDTFDVEWSGDCGTALLFPRAGEVVQFMRPRWGSLHAVNIRRCADPDARRGIRAQVMRHPFVVSAINLVATTSPIAGVENPPGTTAVVTQYTLRDRRNFELVFREGDTSWLGTPRVLQVGDQVVCGISRNLPGGCHVRLVEYHPAPRATAIITKVVPPANGRLSSSTHFILDTIFNDWCFFAEHFTGPKSSLVPGTFVEFDVPFDAETREAGGTRPPGTRAPTVTKVTVADDHATSVANSVLFPFECIVATVLPNSVLLTTVVHNEHPEAGEAAPTTFTVFLDRFVPSAFRPRAADLLVGDVVACMMYADRFGVRMFRATGERIADVGEVDSSTQQKAGAASPGQAINGAVAAADDAHEVASERSSVLSAVTSRCTGVIRDFLPRRNFGFITASDGRLVHFHMTSVRPGTDPRQMRRGVAVEFAVSLNPATGKPIGLDVAIAAPAS